MSRDVIRSTNFVRDAVDFISQVAQEALRERGEFRLALSGGNTPRPIYSELAKDQSLDWSKVIITFGDERCVPPESDQSNYRMALETLIRFIRLEKRNVLRMRGELEPKVAAAEYESQLGALAKERNEEVYQ